MISTTLWVHFPEGRDVDSRRNLRLVYLLEDFPTTEVRVVSISLITVIWAHIGILEISVTSDHQDKIKIHSDRQVCMIHQKVRG